MTARSSNSLSSIAPPDHQVAVFGAGCFWCSEAVFNLFKGVERVTSGYAGGDESTQRFAPNYFRVSEGLSNHAEVVEVVFDPQVITYRQLLDIFWHSHDPTTRDQQGADVGPQYRSLILTTSPEQQAIATALKAELMVSGEVGQPIVTEIKPLGQFYPAEEYHQLFYDRNRTEPYCQVVIDPKVEKVKRKYAGLLKEENLA